MIIRLHVSESPTLLRVANRRHYRRQRVYDKPDGFWWSVGTEWMEYCEGNEWNIGGHVYLLGVNEDNLLRISTYEEFDAFHDKFKASRAGITDGFIDWRAVSEEWDGIEISPYLYRRRLHAEASWYYGWDCACGVTWRPAAVIYSVTPVGEWTKGNIPGTEAS